MKELKGSRFAHVTKAHPCFNEKMHDKVGRVHVPIAPKCNIYCNFCTRDINSDENRPGVASCVMNLDSALEHVQNVTEEGPISVVGVAGPGDSLANPDTIEFFKRLSKENPDLIKCMSTNGLLLPDLAEEIAKAGVNTVTVTVNAIDPEIAEKIYTFVKYDGNVIKGRKGVELLIKNQLDGIQKLSDLGVIIKVNSVLIPGINDEHIVDIAREVKERGASLMNVLPLIPLNKMKDIPKPSCAEIEKVRADVEEIIPVFRACTQCRADAYGIPGKHHEDHHLGMTPASHY
ncbi:MAG: radical SAM protein [Methanobrevibacter sp.]|jgi:nitrogen fixation protein NifB|nr:radical SAM protein [Candidatus Methanoflexus mossambicus]